ncbi:MAG: hypothetical protein QT11_C0001G0946 [archaeon GW2011_AR20]|nr:MAG: hypothetical protein QT11_C0001G0946 [archaeon GW2011_AR20]MBS3160168.1 hypothetical protein [Candidatus Woesearchaeota archaeon]
MKKLMLLFMLLLVTNLVSAQIGVQEVFSQPNKVAPGEKLTIRIMLENFGEDEVSNVAVKLDLTDLPFAPVDSSTEQVTGKIEEDERKQLVFNLIALPEAEPRIYKIPLKITYNNTVKESLISINVESKPELDLVLESSELVKVNDNGKIILKLINLGLSDIKSLRLTLIQVQGYEILSSNTVYISDIDVEDFETAEFTLIARERNPRLLFNINYKDVNNNEYAENKELALNVYTVEEAKQLGLVQNNIFLSILIPIITIVIIYFIYRKLRKRKI